MIILTDCDSAVSSRQDTNRTVHPNTGLPFRNFQLIITESVAGTVLFGREGEKSCVHSFLPFVGHVLRAHLVHGLSSPVSSVSDLGSPGCLRCSDISRVTQ